MGLSFHEMQAAAQEMSLRAVFDEDLSNYTLCDDGRYEVYTEYTDDAVSEVDKHKNITVNEEQCNLTQEENSQYVPFKLPRYWDGVDLMTKLIQFHYVNINGGSGISTAVNVRFNDSYIICGWLINKSVTAVAGDVTFEITATGTNEKSADYRWRTRPNGKFTVLEALSYDGIIEPSDDWYAGFVKSMQEYTTKAAESARSAQDYADQSKSNLDQVTQITETFTTNAQEVKETAINEINNAKVSGVNAVEAAATEIVNDREKITENANNISLLKGDISDIVLKSHSINTHDGENDSMIMVGYQLSGDGNPIVNSSYTVIKARVYAGKTYIPMRINSAKNAFVGFTQRMALTDVNGVVKNVSNYPQSIQTAEVDGYLLAQFNTTTLTNKEFMVLENPSENATYVSGEGANALYDYLDVYVDYFEKTEININKLDREIPYVSDIFPWFEKTWVGYGDSIMAISNGDGLNLGWAAYVNKLLKFGAFHGRGIGSQKYAWGTNGGSVAFVDSDGNLHSRNDAYNKDDYTGSIPEGCTAIRGCFCSWDRITHMIPESIRNDIDLVYIMGGTNDDESKEYPTWVADDETDPEWKVSDFYATYGGDYNISTLEGGVASTIMKMQAWCPNAVIAVGTPLSGRGNTGELKPSLGTTEYTKTDRIKITCGLAGIPIVDVNRTCGINGLNRTNYIADQVHPYTDEGKMMLGRAVAGGLMYILPMQKLIDSNTVIS